MEHTEGGWVAHVSVGAARIFAGSYASAPQAALAYNAMLETLITAGLLVM